MDTKRKPRKVSDLPAWQLLLLLLIALILASVFGIDLFQLLEQEESTSSMPAPAVTSVYQPGLPDGAVAARLLGVIDGDTIEVEIAGVEETVRYVGIDTPESNQPGYAAATAANRRLLGDGPIFLVPDRSDRDRYGRMLRFVYRADGKFVNAEMIFQGYAQPIEFRPDVTKAIEFRRLAKNAAEDGRGFWSGQAGADGVMPYALTLTATKLREGAGRNQPIQETVPPGTPLTVYGQRSEGRWLFVRTPDRAKGWVEAADVRANVPVDQIPEDVPESPRGLLWPLLAGVLSGAGGWWRRVRARQ